jgi:hypothetical protein
MREAPTSALAAGEDEVLDEVLEEELDFDNDFTCEEPFLKDHASGENKSST